MNEIDEERIIGAVKWAEEQPYHYGTYTGVTLDGRDCFIDVDWKTKCFVGSEQIGTDKIAFWNLRVKHLKSLMREVSR